MARLTDDGMADHFEMNLGEIARDVADIKTQLNVLTTQMQAAFGPLAVLQYRMDTAEKDLNEVHQNYRTVQAAIDGIKLKAAYVAGVIAAIGLIGQIVFELIKH